MLFIEKNYRVDRLGLSLGPRNSKIFPLSQKNFALASLAKVMGKKNW
jgi:hypothetical protein